MVFGGISISLLLLFGLVLKESSQKTSGRSLSEQNEKKTDSAMEIVNAHDTISDLEVGLEKIKAESSDLKTKQKQKKI
ncbi:hypothetical protein AMR47_08770 [Leptospira interrogans]|nr:hypothetical protein AMR47_08770 [Leptospira interrogans]